MGIQLIPPKVDYVKLRINCDKCNKTLMELNVAQPEEVTGFTYNGKGHYHCDRCYGEFLTVVG